MGVPPNQPSYMPVSVSLGILKHGGELHGAQTTKKYHIVLARNYMDIY